MDIETKRQEQKKQTVIKERILQEAEEKAMQKFSQQMQAKTDIIQQQAGEATEVAFQSQSAAQATSATMTEYEAKMATMAQTLSQLQQLIIDEQKKRIDMESQLSAAQDKIGAAEQQRNVLAMKNQKLESEVVSWITAFNKQSALQKNPIGSSSSFPQQEQTI